MRAQGTSGTCGLAVELPPLGDRPRGSRVWCDFQYVGEYRPPFGDGPHGSHKGQCPLTPDCAPCAQGTSGTCGLAVELPPLGDGPRGSRVLCDFQYVGEYRPPFGDGPHGSHKGQCPLTPDCAPCAQGTSGTCGLAVELPPLGDGPRGSRVLCDFQYVGEYRPPFGNGPHGSRKKASVDLNPRWPFALQKYPSHIVTSKLASLAYALRRPRGRGRR